MSNHPFEQVLMKATQLALGGAWLFQKYDCEHCGQRLTMDDANVFYTHGACDRCGRLTDIRKAGCNYMIVLSDNFAAVAKSCNPPPRPGLTLCDCTRSEEVVGGRK